MKYSFIVTLLLFLLFSSVKGQISGIYANDNQPDIFQFNSDFTFKYEFRSFHSFRFAEGRWSVDKNGKYIILNSYKQQLQPITDMHVYSFISKYDNPGERAISFQFATDDKSKAADFRCEIVINDTIYDIIKDGNLSSSGKGVRDFNKNMNPRDFWQTYFRCDSLNRLEFLKVNVPIRTIYFQFVYSPVQPTTDFFTNNIISSKLFRPKNVYDQLKFRVALADSLFFYRIFSDEKVKIKRNKIAVFIESAKRWKILRLVPTEDKVFINP